MSEYVYAGLTSQTIDVVLYDSSTGLPMTGLAYNTAGLKAYYRKGATGTATAITLATQTVGGAWSSGGFVQIDSSNMKGHYRLDLPNAAVDTAGFVTICISGATDLAQLDQRIDCRPLPVDVKQFGGTNGTFNSGRPEVNATHVSGTSQTAGDLAALITTVDTVVDAVKAKTDNLPSDPADASDIAAAFSTVNTKLDTIDGIVDSILVDTAVIGAAGAGLTSIPWNASWDAEVQSECTDALNAYDPPTRAELTTDTNSVLTAVGDVPTNAELATALAAADDAVLAAVGTVDTVVDAIKAVTDKIDTGLVLDGAVYQFTASMLELGPSGSGGGGDATLAKQEEILDAIETLSTSTGTEAY